MASCALFLLHRTPRRAAPCATLPNVGRAADAKGPPRGSGNALRGLRGPPYFTEGTWRSGSEIATGYAPNDEARGAGRIGRTWGMCRESVRNRWGIPRVPIGSSRARKRNALLALWESGRSPPLGLWSDSGKSHGAERGSKLSLLTGFVDLAVDASDLTQPDVPLVVLHVEDRVERPMEVIGDVGYLLVELLQGVAYDPPWPTTRPSPPPSRSMSNSCWHEGHLAWTRGAPSSLMRR